MMNADGVLDARYSDKGARPTPWHEVEERLGAARLFWLSTVRPDGRPHVTPLIGLWWDGAFVFITGPEERKTRNLAMNSGCVVTTGTNTLDTGMDIVVEGEAVRITETALLSRLAVAYEAKYGADWHFDIGDGVLVADHGEVLVFTVAPDAVFAFAKGASSQTKWSFA